MKALLNNLSAAWANGQFRWPLIGAIVLEVFPIWFPALKPQCQETQKVLLAYGLIAAHAGTPEELGTP
jgi:hypothetical protein